MRYAFFDLDHTLLPFDTQALFCNFVLRRQPWRIVLHLWFIPFAIGRAIGLVSTATAKRAFNSYLAGMKRAHLRRLARDFAHDCVDTWIYPELRAEILRHKHQDRRLVLNTASPDCYADQIAEVLGFDHCVSTRFQIGNEVPLRPPLARGRPSQLRPPRQPPRHRRRRLGGHPPSAPRSPRHRLMP